MANIISEYTGSTNSTIVSMGSNIPLCWHQFLLFILKQRLLLNWDLFATFLIISEKILPQFLEYWVSKKSPTGFWMCKQDIFPAHLKLDFNSMASLHHHFAWRKFLEYQIHLYSQNFLPKLVFLKNHAKFYTVCPSVSKSTLWLSFKLNNERTENKTTS